uniref:Uncharacterized protein n=1 Tax=Anguilla anguilla TaxID=7936 RepID=A0A0E9TF57_ANGAN
MLHVLLRSCRDDPCFCFYKQNYLDCKMFPWRM